MKRILSVAAFSILGGLLAHVGIFYLIRIEPPAIRPAPVDTARFDYVGDLGVRSDPVLRQQALLFDSAPLFMPTRWNPVSEMSDVASLREAAEVFDVFPPHLNIPDSPPDIQALPFVRGSLDSLQLPEDPSFFLSRFGQRAVTLPDLPPSGPSIHPFRLDTGGGGSVSPQSIPSSLEAMIPDSLWSPALFYLQIVHGKVLGVPATAQSSGFSDWDRALQDFLGSLDFYHRLDSGYYRVTVYP